MIGTVLVFITPTPETRILMVDPIDIIPAKKSCQSKKYKSESCSTIILDGNEENVVHVTYFDKQILLYLMQRL